MSPQMTIDRLAIIINQSFKDFEARFDSKIDALRTEMNQGFERITRLERKIDSFERRFDSIDTRFDRFDLLLDNHEDRLSKLEN